MARVEVAVVGDDADEVASALEGTRERPRAEVFDSAEAFAAALDEGARFRAVVATTPAAAEAFVTAEALGPGTARHLYGEDPFLDHEYQHVACDESIETLAMAVAFAVDQGVQAPYPLSGTEERRQATVEAYTPSDLDISFDRLAECAANATGSDVALVTVIDGEWQRALGSHGVPGDEVPREESVCAHTVAGGRPLVVPDLRADERFADSERLAAAGLRSYLGVPLVAANGEAIGTVCLLDGGPRRYDDALVGVLERFADRVVDRLNERVDPAAIPD